MNFWARWDKRDPAKTHTSLILKRQVPIRFDEEPRSWLGGLPLMPKGTKWPRDAEGAPLHFIAQIACADLPQALWNGHGPRRGWLLLFVNVQKLEDEAEGGIVQVLHTAKLGVEHTPPDDMTTVRHAMSDHIGSYKPEIRPGVPKLWRKWPVDLVVHQYRATDDELAENGPPMMTAEQLYQAPVSDLWISAYGTIPLDRPLTWRGALYVVEGVLRDLTPDKFERDGGLLDAPVGDSEEYSEAYRRRAVERDIYAFDYDPDKPGSPYERREARIKAMEAELKAEFSSGWIKRSVAALERERQRLVTERDRFQRMIDSGMRTETEVLRDTDRPWAEQALAERKDDLIRLEQRRLHMTRIEHEYLGPEGEARLGAEIKSRGEAHLARLPELRAQAQHLLDRICNEYLDAVLPDTEWRAIQTQLDGIKSTYWQKSNGVPEHVERGLSINRSHVEEAIREDVLDIYTRNNGQHPAISPELLEDIEKRLRHIELPHQMGGLAIPIQNGFDLEMLSEDPGAFLRSNLTTPKLVFQIGSDVAMGWMWGDVGALYVTVPTTALRFNIFKPVHAWIEAH